MFDFLKQNEKTQISIPTLTGRLETTLDQLVNDVGKPLSGRVHKLDISEYLSEYSDLSKLPTKVQRCVRTVLDDYLNAENESYFQINEFIFGIYLGKAPKAVGELKIQVIRNELIRTIENIKQQKRVSINENCVPCTEAGSSSPSAESYTSGICELKSKEMCDWSSRIMLNMRGGNGFKEFQDDITRLSKTLELQFRPLWYVPNNILSGYVVEAKSCFFQFEHRDKQAQADLAILAAAVRHLKAMTERNELALLIVPVHIQTICDRTTRDLFNIYCHSIEPELKKFLVLRVKGIDARKMNQAADWNFLNAAAAHYRSIIIEPPRKKIDFKELPRKFHAFGLDLTDLNTPEKYLFNLINRFAGHYQKGDRHSYILGVQTKSLLLAAVNAGYCYISGPAISSFKSSPEHARFLKLEALYREC